MKKWVDSRGFTWIEASKSSWKSLSSCSKADEVARASKSPSSLGASTDLITIFSHFSLNLKRFQ